MSERRIVSLHRGETRPDLIYGRVVAEDGALIGSATLDFIVDNFLAIAAQRGAVLELHVRLVPDAPTESTGPK